MQAAARRRLPYLVDARKRLETPLLLLQTRAAGIPSGRTYVYTRLLDSGTICSFLYEHHVRPEEPGLGERVFQFLHPYSLFSS